MKNKLLKLSVGLLGTGALSACGGGTSTGTISQGSGVINGQFIDSPVSGLRYESSQFSGVTDEAGNFQCQLAEPVSFYIGAVEIGSSTCQRIITPQTLAAEIIQSAPQTITSASGVVTTVAGSSQTLVNSASPTDPAVVNRVRLLLTLDTDDDPSNGIQLPSQTEQAQLSQTSVNFKNTAYFEFQAAALIQQLPSVSNKSVQDSVSAQAHFSDTLQTIPAVTGELALSGRPAPEGNIGQYYDVNTGLFNEAGLQQSHPEIYGASETLSPDRGEREGDDDEYENERDDD